MAKNTGKAVSDDMARRANERQVGGDHYAKPIQPWDYITANGIGYLEGNIIKYVSRHHDKNGLEDLQKARHYLDKLIEIEEAQASEKATMPELRRVPAK